MIQAITRRLLRLAVGGFQNMRKGIWFFSRPRTFGVHAVALTPEGRVVLVRLRYASGWRLPGGGRKKGEDPQAAVLRELREEIGMTAHGGVLLATELSRSVDFKRDCSSLFIVRDVAYRPRWSIEVEAVTEAPLDRLPGGLAAPTRRWLRMVAPLL